MEKKTSDQFLNEQEESHLEYGRADCMVESTHKKGEVENGASSCITKKSQIREIEQNNWACHVLQGSDGPFS